MLLITKIYTAFNNWRTQRKTIAELSQLTDKELYDIGIHRSNIYSVAKKTSANSGDLTWN